MYKEKEYMHIFDEISERFNCPVESIKVEKELGGGKSGDKVYLISVSDSANIEEVGEYILKISANGNQEEFNNEMSNTYEAGRKCDSHKVFIPELLFFSPNHGYYVYDVAGRNTKEISTLCEQQINKKILRFEEFIDESLFAWSACFDVTEVNLRQMVIDWVGEKRLETSSRIACRVRDLINDEFSEGWKVNSECILPNPFYYFSVARFDEERSLLRNVLHGPQHGDMNQKNVILEPVGKSYNYYLIDFSHYRSNTFALFDQAYLFLDVLLNSSNLLMTEWVGSVKSFFDCLCEGKDYKENKKDLSGCFSGFLRGWKRFYSRYPRNGKTLIIQLLSACIATGLNFLNKCDIDESKQLLSFTFASVALNKLIQYDIGISFDNDGDYPTILNDETGNISRLWKVADCFSQTSRFVLVSSCLSEDVHPDLFSSIGMVPWTAVIEMNNLLENELRNKALKAFRSKQGYQHVLLTGNNELVKCSEDAVWCSVVVDNDIKNVNLFYTKYIQSRLRDSLTSAFAKYEKYPICVLVDSHRLNPIIVNNIVTDILISAGENTFVDIINLSQEGIEIDEEISIKLHNIPCSLSEVARSIQIGFKSYDLGRILVPSQETIIPLENILVNDIELDMKIIHRNLATLPSDDQGDGFYRGGEATWQDIASQRDVQRWDYDKEWRNRIAKKLDHLHMSTSSLIWLFHKPGGGGSTMAKRIMWDFCTQYPTVSLEKVSPRTAERLQLLYKKCIKPLLIVAEINDSVISNTSISALRAELIRKNVRALFICVIRKNERHIKKNSYDFYLPDTPQMYMADDEATRMYNKFIERLDENESQDRMTDLNELTYSDKYSEELRQPFFYGLFAFGENYRKIDEYVQINLKDRESQVDLLLKILAFNTVYSQTVNLNLQEISHILFPKEIMNRETIEKIREIISKNCFIVNRGNGYRISHPIIAKRILEQLLGEKNYYEKLIELAKDLVESLHTLYDDSSTRLNAILHELFIHREPITDEERTCFSSFITELSNDQQRIQMMHFMNTKFLNNPHFSNHLARLYLKPLDENQWPDIDNAKVYASEAISRAEALEDDSSSIHHHLMGKVYSGKCIFELNKMLAQRYHITQAIKKIVPVYKEAMREFNVCIANRNNTYGLVGKLELISKIFKTINTRYIPIKSLLRKEESVRGVFTDMIAEAGDIIQKYSVFNDDQSVAFRSALLKFYEATGRINDIDTIFGAREVNLSVRVNSRRSIVTLLEYDARKSNASFSYNMLSTDKLTKIRMLMEANIYKDYSGNFSDRIRWIESYRRLDDFDLHKAYQFIQEWPESKDNLEVSYYRYVLAFVLYSKYQDVTYDMVKEHMIHCQQLAQKAYGKYTTISKDFLGLINSDNDKDSLVSWRRNEHNLSQEERESLNKEYRESQGVIVQGVVSSIDEGVVEFRFSMEHSGSKLFYAKAPRVGEVSNLLDGQAVKFHIGFSYTGFRAWDITEIE